MRHFNEHTLEMAIMELFEQQGYSYQNGETIHKELYSHFALEECAMHDKDLMDDVRNERKVMDNLYNYLYTKNHPLHYWFYGHFHFHNSEYVDNTKFIMLDMWRNGKYDFYDIPFDK